MPKSQLRLDEDCDLRVRGFLAARFRLSARSFGDERASLPIKYDHGGEWSTLAVIAKRFTCFVNNQRRVMSLSGITDPLASRAETDADHRSHFIDGVSTFERDLSTVFVGITSRT